MWRKYNDGYVTEIKDAKEIFEQEPGERPATPYFLVYVLDQSKERLVDSVCRDVVEPQPEEQLDTVMEDYSQGQQVCPDEETYRAVNSSTDYDTVDSYNSHGWTHGEGLEVNNAWPKNEAQVPTSW